MAGDEQRPLLPTDHHPTPTTSNSDVAIARRQTKRFLTSKAGHYSVLALVSLDISSIFADLILQLVTCEGRVPAEDGAKAQEALGIVSLIFSCLFMLELLASIWAFGWQFFNSRFHCFDAVIILVGFLIDVVLKGPLEELGSLVVVLRLWRVFKIFEELSAGAEEQIEPLQERLEGVEKENRELKTQIEQMKTDQSLQV